MLTQYYMKEKKIIDMLMSRDTELAILGVIMLAGEDLEWIKAFMMKYGSKMVGGVDNTLNFPGGQNWKFVSLYSIHLSIVHPFTYFKLDTPSYYMLLGSNLNIFHYLPGYKMENNGSVPIIETKQTNI